MPFDLQTNQITFIIHRAFELNFSWQYWIHWNYILMSRFAEIDYNVINNVFTCDVCTPLRFHRDSSNFRNISPMLISRIMLIRSSGHSRWRPSAVKNSLGRVAVALFYWKGSGTGTRENVTGNDGEITGEHLFRSCQSPIKHRGREDTSRYRLQNATLSSPRMSMRTLHGSVRSVGSRCEVRGINHHLRPYIIEDEGLHTYQADHQSLHCIHRCLVR